MKRVLWVGQFLVMLVLVACAVVGSVLGPTPEAQIVNGGNTITAVATIGTAALRNNKVTAAQSRSYKSILDTAHAHLKQADADLLVCRKATNSTRESNPDPCSATIEADIRLAVDIAGSVKKTIDAKK